MTIRKDTSGHPSLGVFSPMMPGARLIEELEIGSFVAPPFPREWPETLRVASWNINRCFGSFPAVCRTTSAITAVSAEPPAGS